MACTDCDLFVHVHVCVCVGGYTIEDVLLASSGSQETLYTHLNRLIDERAHLLTQLDKVQIAGGIHLRGRAKAERREKYESGGGESSRSMERPGMVLIGVGNRR